MIQLSIVSPVYEAEAIIDELVNRIITEVEKRTTNFEIVLVEDGSQDKSWQKINENCNKDKRVKGIKLSKNFGQHYAITAGIAKSTGENIVIMDCDLQDNPVYIIDLLDQRQNGNEIIFTTRRDRKHGAVKSFSSWAFNKLFFLFSEKKYRIDTGTMVLFSKRVGKEYLNLKDKDRLYIQMLKWMGFRNTTIEVEHMPRFAGKSTYGFRKLMSLGLQGWTSHSGRLLRLSTYIGFLLALCSFLGGIFVFIKYLFYDMQPGWPSIIITILFSTGLILLSIGILGVYIGKIFEQSKDRPLFIIENQINIDE